jgi:hypothetical protein
LKIPTGIGGSLGTQMHFEWAELFFDNGKIIAIVRLLRNAVKEFRDVIQEELDGIFWSR